MDTHFADKTTDFEALCESPGPVSETRYDCNECVCLLRRRRAERRMVETAQTQANRLLKKRKQRIERAKERRSGMSER